MSNVFEYILKEIQARPYDRCVKKLDKEKLVRLIEKGLPINFANDEGITPLNIAANCLDVDLVKRFLDLGADGNQKLKDGSTVLLRILSDFANNEDVGFLADHLFEKHDEIFKLILCKGIDLSIIVSDNKTVYEVIMEDSFFIDKEFFDNYCDSLKLEQLVESKFDMAALEF